MPKKAKADYFFEVSWEVCNKVGGIYTVVTSKAARMMDYYDGNYFLIGPYFPDKSAGVFEEEMPPDVCKECIEKLKEHGIKAHYGKWLIKGNPNVILIDFEGFSSQTNEIKKQLWENYEIDSLNSEYYDFGEPVVWSTAVGLLLEALVYAYKDKKIVAQFHEWLSGAALLYLKKNDVSIGKVFTTHATMLGRTLAGDQFDLYNKIEEINPEDEARKKGIIAKHQTEKQCAKNADIFTTVSEITAIEAEKLLERKPEVILDNGLDIEKFPTFEETSLRHHKFKIKIKDFILYYFFPYYSFDLDNTLIYFIAGRYEFHDKGIDVFIKALGMMNKKLKSENSKRTIIAFFWVPGPVKGIKPNILENKTYYEDVKETIDGEMDDMKHRLTHGMISGEEMTCDNLLSEEARSELKRKVLKLRKNKKTNPPLSTHDLNNEDSDAILKGFRENGLDNSEEQKVKVVFYPIYLTGADGLLDTSYYESMVGSHFGVFPSFYEPWGYTPLEGAALGVPSVTTDLSGFGRYILNQVKTNKYPGVFVLKRFGKTTDEVTKELAETMHNFATLSAHDRIENKMSARNIAETADWETFAENYIESHNLALEKLDDS